MRLQDGLTLDQLTERGLVNEVWLLADHTERSAPWETVEVKRAYDEAFRPLARFEPYAGNSGEHDAPWLGRSLRILFINFDRGVGCAMESLGHSLERMASCGAIPYYEQYFDDYVAACGNVHFTPNGRFDYDLDNPERVLSTIESWRQPGQEARAWTIAELERYRDLAPDCMGRWVVYWRQNMPGLDNTALDDEGRPMKAWWPFLFY
jgi:hypothetical protein